MKDPLQTEQTPYEILGIERGASDADIDNAFQKRLAERPDVQKVRRLTEARTTLQRPTERAMVDIFQYDTQVVSRLTPNPLQDISVLQLPNRASTAAAWGTRLRTAFPDLGTAHSLAVLWYWWAVYEAEIVRQPTAPIPVDQLWQRVIACWAMLITSDSQARIPADLVVERLRNKLHDFGQRQRDNGAAELADRYRQLELALSTEIQTARNVASAGIRTSRGKISCGPLMLQHVDLLDTIRKQIDESLQKNASSAGLKSLRDALSPYSSIAVLIDSKKPQAALDAINALPARERDSKEVSKLQARALYELGKQQASLGQFNEALDSWGSALRCTNVEGIDAEIRSEIVSTCQTRAMALQRRQRGDAIIILEKGLGLVEDEKLKLTLADLLTQQGIETINEAQKKAEQEKTGITRDIMAALERGLADLKRAANLGSKRAAEQAEIARGLVEQAKSGFLDIPEKAAALLRQVNDAAAVEDWDKVISCLREAIKEAGSKAPETLRKNLAVHLSNRAIQNANKAVEMLDSRVKTHEVMFELWTHQHLRQNPYSDNCTLCGRSNYSSYGESWYSFNLPGGETTPLCASCAETVRGQARQPGPSPMEISLLESAQADLSEATKLDPLSDHIRKNLADVQALLSKIGAIAAPSPSIGSTSSSSHLLIGVKAREEKPLPSTGSTSSSSSTTQQKYALSTQERAAPSPSTRSTSSSSSTTTRQRYVSSTQERRASHKWLLGAINCLALLITCATYSLGGRLTWLADLGIIGAMTGMIEIMAVVIGSPQIVPLFWNEARPMTYMFEKVCGTRWQLKDSFARLSEVVLYCFLILLGTALALGLSQKKAGDVALKGDPPAVTQKKDENPSMIPKSEDVKRAQTVKETSPAGTKPASPAGSKSPPSGKTLRKSIGMEFVLIPAGTFQMGSSDRKAYNDEQPVHTVRISKAFYLGKYEVTQGQWQAIMGINPSQFQGDPNLPVENVSWEDVQEFIQKLNNTEGGTKYRLPTEAEWEYAARAGTTTVYSFGNDSRQLIEYAWYWGNAISETHPVGQKKPNPWGLYDMYGNVGEWVQDWYGLYTADSAVDPTGPTSGSRRVYRGGGWHFAAGPCRSAVRNGVAPDKRDAYLGLRLLREMQ